MTRAALLFAGALLASPAAAGVVRIEAEPPRPVPAASGGPAYEIVTGVFHGELDPAAPANRIITDIARAPRNARGQVEYAATFRIARPVDPARASGVLIYDVPNRGNGSVAADADGHVRAISGWQGDIPPAGALQTARVPVAVGPGGKPITGPVLTRLVKVPATARSVLIGGGLTNTPRPAPVSLDTARASLWRETRGGARVLIASGDWAFADCQQKPFPGAPSPRHLCLRDGFDPDAAYTLVYTGRDPLVLGIGFAATRDFVAFLRSDAADNPARGMARWAIGHGVSQSGNFLRSFVRLGFNADEAGRRVFDGINPMIAARQVPLNLRFGVPGGAAGTFEPGSEGTLWWGTYDDRRRRLGRSSLLDRCTRTGTCPKVIETLGSAEFWGLRASPGFVGTDARRDIALPANVRRYYFPSTTHGGSLSHGFLPAGDTGMWSQCRLPGNPNPLRAYFRVTQRMLLEWVRDGREPPPSRQPTLAGGDLVAPTATAMGWPAIPGAPLPDGHLNPFTDHDFGPGLVANDVSGSTSRQPPRVRGELPLLVPRVNADGNETAGVPSVHLLVPLGTYTGWNIEPAGYNAGRNCGFAGGFIPFARTRAEREARGDPRPSLEERYGDHAGFVARVREVAARQVAEGWLLADDAARIVSDAEASAVLR